MDRRDFIKVAGAGAAVVALPGVSSGSSKLTESEIEARINEMLPQLSLEEKVSQMSGRISLGIRDHAKGYGQKSPFRTPGIERFGIPGIRFIDGPKGINFEGSTAFPVAMARGATWDSGLVERVGQAIGYEARAGGANYFGGVCINVLRHPAGGRAQESFGEDPCHLGVMGAATTRGVQNHVMACAKHYCCNNHEDARFYVNVKVDERTLREIYLPHFKACVDAGAASVMSAYNDVNGYLCGHNSHLLRDILKSDWGFEGFVVSDFGQGVEGTVGAANAGLDIEMPATVYYGKKLVRAVKAGKVPEEHIDEAVTRILRQKLRFIHLENAPGYDKSRVAGREHAELALETSRKSMVLLKNDKGILPLKREGLKKIAVLGGLADTKNIGDNGSSIVRPPYVITALQGIRGKLGPDVEVIYEDGKDLEAAKVAARGAEAVIVVAGLNYEDEGEGGMPGRYYFVLSGDKGGDRERLGLHKREVELIKAVSGETDRLIVVLEGGSAITMSGWKDRAQAILMAWYPGMQGGNAIADILFGEANPCGRLPFVWPRTEDQCAPLNARANEIEYDYYHGYRLLDKNGEDPEFPFGFGLSYTNYKYSNLRLNRKKIGKSGKVFAKVDVKNVGKRAGEEVVQLYAGYNGSKVDRSVKDLKGFGKLALEPGEKKTMSLDLKASDLAYYCMEKGAWEVEEIEYVVYVGPSSRREDLLTDKFRVSGA